MQNISAINLTNWGLCPLEKAEAFVINGGGLLEYAFDTALFLVSPALGLFNLGIKAGYKEAERENK